MNEQQLEEKAVLQAAVRQVADEYLKDPNITSVGLGYKVKDGKPTDEVALQFTVGEKIAPEGLESAATQPIPTAITVNGKTFPTDVVERDFKVQPIAVTVETKPERKRRTDPLTPGVSVGNANSSDAGTLGCLVRENDGGGTRMLSNWHVLHGEKGKLGDPIAQPGPHDDNRAAENLCGRLERSFLGLAGDCAIASLDGRAAREQVLDLEVPVREIGDPELGDRVVKSGRTTGVTYGIVTRVHTITKIAYKGAGPHEIGGFEIGPDPDRPAANEEISMSGDSGSVWLATNAEGEASEMMLGLHFAGETTGPAEYAVACYASSVFEKLEISPLAPPAAEGAVVIEQAASGYDPRFLPGEAVIDVPVANAKVSDDYAPTKAGDLIRHYTHFSLAMSASRRFCRWVAWNIDGSGLKKLKGHKKDLERDGLDFVLDDAYESSFQVDNDLYANNALDRGHIARRADLLWGSLAEAEGANRDSFYFTNITPQLEDFNQSSKKGLWGRLENAVFEDVTVDDLRMSVFAGPLFKDTDFRFRDVLVPRSFWKLLVYVEDGTLKAAAYLLTQDDLEAKLESVGFEEFNLYQTALSELTAATGLDFGPLAAADTLPAAPEGAATPTVRRIEARAELVA